MTKRQKGIDAQWLKRDRRPNQFSGESAEEVREEEAFIEYVYIEELDANACDLNECASKRAHAAAG